MKKGVDRRILERLLHEKDEGVYYDELERQAKMREGSR
jgi:hypothetical protein